MSRKPGCGESGLERRSIDAKDWASPGQATAAGAEIAGR
jgi:hypothetical protein